MRSREDAARPRTLRSGQRAAVGEARSAALLNSPSARSTGPSSTTPSFRRSFGTDPERVPPERKGWLTGFGALGLALQPASRPSVFLQSDTTSGTGIIVVCTHRGGRWPLFIAGPKKPPGTRRKHPAASTDPDAIGFTSLCLVEGGLYGHAIAWLVSVPLCALLLTGRKAAIAWIAAAFLAASFIVAVDTVPALSWLNSWPVDFDYNRNGGGRRLRRRVSRFDSLHVSSGPYF